VDQKLADIGGRLDQENPSIVPPQPSPDSVDKRNVEIRVKIVVRERQVPSVIDPNALARQDRPEELKLENMRADAPEIEEATAPRLDDRKRATSRPTRTRGNGDASALLKVSESARPVATTAQLVVASSRVRQTVLR
jgi:hypothetical protein